MNGYSFAAIGDRVLLQVHSESGDEEVVIALELDLVASCKFQDTGEWPYRRALETAGRGSGLFSSGELS